MSKWVRVKDRLPELGRLVIIYDGCCVKFGHLSRFGLDVIRCDLESGGGGYTTRITHWQELPKPPQSYTSNGKEVFYKGTPMSPEYTAMLLNILDCEVVD